MKTVGIQATMGGVKHNRRKSQNASSPRHVDYNNLLRRHPGASRINQANEHHRVRKRVEEILGWRKTIGTLQKLRHRGKQRVG